MNIILFGPPGAGKGTQADNITETFNLYKISTGDLLRDEIKKKTTLGLKIKSTIESGSLAPDENTNKFVPKRRPGYSKSEKIDPWVSKSEPKGTKSEPKGSQREQKVSQREPKGSPK